MNSYSGTRISVVIFSLVAFMMVANLFAHCQVPCGIYTDDMRFDMIGEDLATIEKAMTQIDQLGKATPINYNQIVRWVNTKETHANKIQEIVDKYFLTQRVKPVDAGDKTAFAAYQQKLVVLHQMLVYAMKCKQSTDTANVTKVKALLSQFRELYFGKSDQKHLESHHK